MKKYIIYLRKSRLDSDFDNSSVEETLSRHETILTEFCRTKNLNVVLVLKEVASGESLKNRPEMQRLLELVNTGEYAGVVCMDIERLSRGDLMETGFIMQTLQFRKCQIITPSKTYDLSNESDEQFTELKFMFSRFELKSITTRLTRGRNQSASEGKFMGSMPPYGYTKYKLQGEKGNSLEINPEEADIVRFIFDLYGKKGMGYNTIAYELNQLGIPSRTGKWGQTSIANIINNEVYIGLIRWKYNPTVKQIENGITVKKKISNPQYELYRGKHEAIITQEQWDLAKKKQQEREHLSLNRNRELKSPLASLLLCEKCGAVMRRKTPAKYQNTSPWYRCPTRGCGGRVLKCDYVEEEVIFALKKWLEGYIIPIDPSETGSRIISLKKEKDIVIERLRQLEHQQIEICTFLEKGTYTEELFLKRNAALEEEISRLKQKEKELSILEKEELDKTEEKKKLVPTAQRILDTYDQLTVQEKNDLLKLVLEKVTVFKSTDDVVSLHIYPRLPALN